MNRSISIVIPAYNEASRLPETLRKVEAFLKADTWIFHEILVVDDGSTDETARLADEFAAANPCIRVLRNPGNRGKGYSVRHGMLEAKGAWRLFSDADLSAPIEELTKLWNAVSHDGVSHDGVPHDGVPHENAAPVAIGSRAIDRSLIGVHQPGMRENAGKIFNAVMRLAVGLHLSDTQCGFKLFRADVAEEVFSRQRLERFGFDVEILFIARERGYRIAEVPVRWNHVEGSKVGMFTGLRAFGELLEIRLNSLRGRYK